MIGNLIGNVIVIANLIVIPLGNGMDTVIMIGMPLDFTIGRLADQVYGVVPVPERDHHHVCDHDHAADQVDDHVVWAADGLGLELTPLRSQT